MSASRSKLGSSTSSEFSQGGESLFTASLTELPAVASLSLAALSPAPSPPPSASSSASRAGPTPAYRRATLAPGRGPSPAPVFAPPVNPVTGAPETAEEAKNRRRSSKKPQQVARLRATFSKYPKFPAAAAGQRPHGASPLRPPLLGNGGPPHLRSKSNSMASVFSPPGAAPTIHSPDKEEVVRCMAVALRCHIKRGHAVAAYAPATPELFDERLHPITQPAPAADQFLRPPPLDAVYKFVSRVFNAEQLAPECAVLALAYVERVLDTGKLVLVAWGWRRLVLSCLIIASKVWEDQAVWNVDFVNVFSALSVADLNRLEKAVLALLQYNVSLSASLYAKYYFELRDLSDLDDDVFPLKPIDPRSAAAAQARSEGGERRTRRLVRALSSDNVLLSGGPVSGQ